MSRNRFNVEGAAVESADGGVHDGRRRIGMNQRTHGVEEYGARGGS